MRIGTMLPCELADESLLTETLEAVAFPARSAAVVSTELVTLFAASLVLPMLVEPDAFWAGRLRLATLPSSGGILGAPTPERVPFRSRLAARVSRSSPDPQASTA